MQGNCDEAPPEGFFEQAETDIAPRDLLPQQCVILAHFSPFKVVDSSVWTDNVFLRIGGGSFFAPWQGTEGSRMWFTNVTVQGNGQSSTDECLSGCEYIPVKGSQLLQGVLLLPATCATFRTLSQRLSVLFMCVTYIELSSTM